MKKAILIIFTMTLISQIISAQNIGIGTTTPDASAKLDISSTDKGMLVPRLTSEQRLSIPNPAIGLLVYDTNTNNFWFYQNTEWVEIFHTGAGTNSVNSSQLPINDIPWAMAIQGNYIYLVDVSYQLKIIDLISFSIVGNYQFNDFPNTIEVKGDYAYVDADSKLSVIDISDPTLPSLAGDVVFNCDGDASKIDGDHAYLICDDNFIVYDISIPTNPVEIASLSFSSLAYDLAIKGDYAYALVGNSLVVIDISDTTSPAIIQSFVIGNAPRDLAMKDNNLYIFHISTDDLNVISVQDPTNPTQIGILSFSNLVNATDITIAGNYAYLTDELEDNLIVVDISDPTLPLVVDNIYAGPYPREVEVKDDFAYVIDNETSILSKILINTPDFINNLSTPESEIQLDLNSSWSNYSTAFKGGKFYKHHNRVYLEGLIKKDTTSIEVGDYIGKLPACCRPTERIIVTAKQGGSHIRLDIYPTGSIEVITVGSAATEWISLTGINFRTN